MAISLYKRPGVVAFLDDDTDFLELLGEAMPSDVALQLFEEPAPLFQSLHRDEKVLTNETGVHQSALDKVKGGDSAISQILQYWRGDGVQRYSTTRVLVVDYSMPALTGLEVLERLGDWPGARLMLTGQADETLAVNAFNKGLIHHFIPKQSKDLAKRLIEAISTTLERPLGDLEKIWLGNLTREQLTLLRNTSVASWLTDLIKAQSWVEYLVIGSPFGILGLDAAGAAGWLQIEQPNGSTNLKELMEVISSYEFSETIIQNIKEGKLVPDFELQLALRSDLPPRCAPALHLPGAGNVSAAVFPIGHQHGPGPSGGWNYFLKNYPRASHIG